MGSSPADLIASLPDTEREAALTELTVGLSRGREDLGWFWPFWARPEQLPPTDLEWTIWLLMAGRGFGKTRTGAEWVRAEAKTTERIAIVGPTTEDVRDAMIEGESGILAVSPPWFYPAYEPSKHRLTWPNGARASLYTAEEPERLRNKQHEVAWCDELRAWKYPQEAWDNLQFGLRLGKNPRTVVTTTPKPFPLLRSMLKDPTCRITGGSTYDNIAHLSPKFIDTVVRRYEGTRLGRQELHAHLFEDVVGALWTLEQFDKLRRKDKPELARTVVAVDPSGGEDAENDEQGIMVCGRGPGEKTKAKGYVLADRTVKASPDGWGTAAVQAAIDFDADAIVVETNYGGDMCAHVLRSAMAKLRRVFRIEMVTASKAKHVRAEPVSAIYEQNRIEHVGTFDELETEMSYFTTGGYTGEGSPNRADANIWGLSSLLLGTPVASYQGMPVVVGGWSQAGRRH